MILFEYSAEIDTPSTNYLYRPAFNRRKKYSYLRLDDTVRVFKENIEEDIKSNYDISNIDKVDSKDVYCIMSYFRFGISWENLKKDDPFTTRDLSNMVKATEDAIFAPFPKLDDSMVTLSLQQKVRTQSEDKALYRMAIIKNPEHVNLKTLIYLVTGDSRLVSDSGYINLNNYVNCFNEVKFEQR